MQSFTHSLSISRWKLTCYSFIRSFRLALRVALRTEINTGCECVHSDLLLIVDFQRSWCVRCVRCSRGHGLSYIMHCERKFHTPATMAGSRGGCIVGQGRFTVDTQTGHARLGTPLRLAVKLFEAKSATWQAAAFPVPSARRRGERLPNAVRHGHVYTLHYTSSTPVASFSQIYSGAVL